MLYKLSKSYQSETSIFQETILLIEFLETLTALARLDGNNAKDAAEKNNRFSALVLGVVESQPFQRNQVSTSSLTDIR